MRAFPILQYVAAIRPTGKFRQDILFDSRDYVNILSYCSDIDSPITPTVVHSFSEMMEEMRASRAKVNTVTRR